MKLTFRQFYRYTFPALALSVISAMAVASRPESPTNGTVYQAGSSVEIWHDGTNEWVKPEAFWLDYAVRGTGKFWGRGTDYPAYGEVQEHDTLLIETESGPCLMYFFHKRWRRAEDVRRWDPAFNEILGCPRVFD